LEDDAEQSGRKMNEPAKHLIEAADCLCSERRMPFVVRESEVERAQEIADRVYPQNKKLLEEQTGAIIQSLGMQNCA